MAADKTFGVKVTDEVMERVNAMIGASGESSKKEWFEKAVAFMEMQSIKQGATDYSQDLSELEVHTTRIYELVSSMVQRSIFIKDHAVKEVVDKLEQKEAIIGEYQDKAKAATEELQITKELLESVEKDKKELTKQLEDLRTTNINNQVLINELKDKKDNLSDLVSEYKGYADENKQLKEEFSTEKDRLVSQFKELSDQTKDQATEIEKRDKQIESLKNNHAMEIERLTERLDYEKNKALLDMEKEYQQRLLQSNEDYNNRIQAKYDEIDKIRKDYEEKIDTMQKAETTEQPNNKKGQ